MAAPEMLDLNGMNLAPVTPADDMVSSETLVPFNSSVNGTSPGNDAGLAARLIYVIFLLVGLVLNCVLLVSIVKSNRLLGKSINLFVIGLAVANIFDCVGNLPLFIGSSIRRGWGYDPTPFLLCNFDAAFVYAASIVTLVTILWMALERTQAIRAFSPSSTISSLSTTSCCTRALLGYAWLHGLALALPLLVPRFADGRYLCYVDQEAPLSYVWVVIVVGYLAPVMVIVGLGASIVRAAIRERSNSRQLYEADDTGVLGPQQLFAVEVSCAKYVALLFLAWCILQSPYIIMTFVLALNAPPLDTSFPHYAQAVLTWLFICYPIVLPVLTVSRGRNICQRLENHCRFSTCCRDSDVPIPQQPSPGQQKFAEGLSTSSTLSTVPVLFATDDGLHIRVFGPTSKLSAAGTAHPQRGSNILAIFGGVASDVTGAQTPNDRNDAVGRSRPCDVFGSFYSDTSDYDSICDEVDLCSSSDASRLASSGQSDAKANERGDAAAPLAACVCANTDCLGLPCESGCTREQPETENAVLRCSKHAHGQEPGSCSCGLERQPNGSAEISPEASVGRTEGQKAGSVSAEQGLQDGRNAGVRGSAARAVHKKRRDNKAGRQNSVGVLVEGKSRFYDDPTPAVGSPLTAPAGTITAATAAASEATASRSESQLKSSNPASKSKTSKSAAVTPECYATNTLQQTGLQPTAKSTGTTKDTKGVVNKQSLAKSDLQIAAGKKTVNSGALKPLSNNSGAGKTEPEHWIRASPVDAFVAKGNATRPNAIADVTVSETVTNHSENESQPKFQARQMISVEISVGSKFSQAPETISDMNANTVDLRDQPTDVVDGRTGVLLPADKNDGRKKLKRTRVSSNESQDNLLSSSNNSAELRADDVIQPRHTEGGTDDDVGGPQRSDVILYNQSVDNNTTIMHGDKGRSGETEITCLQVDDDNKRSALTAVTM